MKPFDDFLVEILTEELPPKSLLKLASAFKQQIIERLTKLSLSFGEVQFFATPRRLAVLVKALQSAQSEQMIERKGPALAAAFDAAGNPSKACLGFARSCGVEVSDLQKIENEQGSWLAYTQKVPGKNVLALLPALVEQSAMALPIPKRMRWGSNETQFVRPVQAVTMLYGNEIIAGEILGKKVGRTTLGHRFLAPEELSIENAGSYEKQLLAAKVIADFAKRRDIIKEQAIAMAKNKQPLFTEALLDEVTGLVEWPVALYGQFDAAFLDLPQEVLISAMQDHQRYFAVLTADKKLAANFITISNIESKQPERVIKGNERVLRARLSDAAFFYATDAKISLEERLPALKNIVYQAKLGSGDASMHAKAERISKLAGFIAKQLGTDVELAKRAGLLAKADLTTQMVGEFPELQGIMGQYYALQTGENPKVALAINEHYAPRFSGDALPSEAISQAVAIADKLDTLVSIFSIGQLPTGDKDPFGLRRAALGILRIILEKHADLDLQMLVKQSVSMFTLKNAETENLLLLFFQERLKALLAEQGVSADIFAAVAANTLTRPLDFAARVQAVQAFKKLSAAQDLAAANKRVSNLLSKRQAESDDAEINATLFEAAAEKMLAEQLALKSSEVAKLYQQGDYQAVLLNLAELNQPINHFFDEVMVMTEDKAQRENRLLILLKLRALFLQVADIALLQ